MKEAFQNNPNNRTKITDTDMLKKIWLGRGFVSIALQSTGSLYTGAMRDIILVAHNLRSCHNVGSLLRTADGLGVTKVYLTGYTPYPKQKNDERLPHVADKVHKQIQKTALGAETTVSWVHQADIFDVFKQLRAKNYKIAALEQTGESTDLTRWSLAPKVALIIGRETQGIEPEILKACDITLEIPMYGKKESFNVVQAAAMALFYTRFTK